MTGSTLVCGSKVDSERSSLKRSNQSLFVFVGIKGFYKVGNFSSRHFSPVSVLKLLANKRLFKRFYCSFSFPVSTGRHGREMRLYEVRGTREQYRVLPRHSPALAPVSEEANIYFIAALS